MFTVYLPGLVTGDVSHNGGEDWPVKMIIIQSFM